MMEASVLQRFSKQNRRSISEIPGGMENLITQIIETNFIGNVLANKRYAFLMLSQSLYGNKEPKNVDWLERMWGRNQEDVQRLVINRTFSHSKHYFKWGLKSLPSSSEESFEIKQKCKIDLLKYLKSAEGICELKNLMIECNFYQNLQLFSVSLTFENLCKAVHHDVDEDITSLLKYYWFANVDNLYLDVLFGQSDNNKNVVKDVSLLEKAGGIDRVMKVMVDHDFQKKCSLPYAMRVIERINKDLFGGKDEPDSIWLNYLWKSNIDEIQSKIKKFVSEKRITRNIIGGGEPSQPKRQKISHRKKGATRKEVLPRRKVWKLVGSVENVVEKMIDIDFAKKMENKSSMADGIKEVCLLLFGENSTNNSKWVKHVWINNVHQVRSLVLQKTNTQERPYNWNVVGGINCALKKMIESSFMDSYLTNKQAAVSSLSQKLFEKAGSDEYQWLDRMIKNNIEDICCVVKLVNQALISYDGFLSGHQSEGKLIKLMLDPSFSRNVAFLKAASDLSMKVFGKNNEKYIKCIEYIWLSETFQAEYKQTNSSNGIESTAISLVDKKVSENEFDRNIDMYQHKVSIIEPNKEDDISLWTMADGVNNVIKVMKTISFNVYYDIDEEEAFSLLSKNLFNKVDKKYTNWLKKIWDNNEQNIQKKFSLYGKTLNENYDDFDGLDTLIKAGGDLRIINCMVECSFPIIYQLNPGIALKYLSQKVFHSSLYKYRLWLKKYWTSDIKNVQSEVLKLVNKKD